MTPLYSLFAFIFGTIWGSFLSMLMPRLHNDEKGILMGRSHCPHCKKTLRAVDLVPLISYLFLRGRCSACKERISFWYPLTELVSGLFFAAVFLHFQSIELLLWYTPHLIVLLFIFFYDLHYKEIHDAVLLPGILYALFVSFFLGDPINAGIGAVVGFTFFGLQYLLSRGKWIGSGDLRIGLFMGFTLGWPMTFLAILLGYIIGSVISLYLLATKAATAKSSVPLGPFLVLGTVLAFFFGEQLLTFYLRIL